MYVHGIRPECRSTLLIRDSREFNNAYPLSLLVEPSGNGKHVVEFDGTSCLVQRMARAYTRLSATL